MEAGVEGEGGRRKFKVVGVIVLLVAISGVAYFGYSSYEQSVISTTVVQGKVSSVQASTVSLPNLAGGLAQTSTGNQVVNRVNITVGSNSFTVAMPCTSPVTVGQTIRVDDNLLRNGQHQYVADLACRGAVSPFVNPISSTTTSTSHA